MAERKILTFPGRLAATHAAPPVPDRQGTLFPGAADWKGKVAFVDIEGLAEEPLLRLLATNAAKALVDLRPRPVFERPKFRHKNVVVYLHDWDIRYVEFALLVRWPTQGRAIAAMYSSDAYAKIEPALEEGLAICLYDKTARDLGWLDEIRRMLRHAKGYRAEVNPRSLVGMPV